jgi:hypothetical protein
LREYQRALNCGKLNQMNKTKISALKDGQQFYLSPRKKVLYRLDTVEKSIAVITSVSSGRTFHKAKKSICFLP